MLGCGTCYSPSRSLKRQKYFSFKQAIILPSLVIGIPTDLVDRNEVFADVTQLPIDALEESRKRDNGCGGPNDHDRPDRPILCRLREVQRERKPNQVLKAEKTCERKRG